MKKTFPLIIFGIGLFYIFYNITGVEDKLLLVNYIITFLIFLTWIISIIRAIKENKKSKVIPCIIITILSITAIILNYIIIYPNEFIQFFTQIGLALFLYEIIDLFKITFKANLINIISVSLCFMIIIMFGSTQIIKVDKFAKSLKDISNFITSDDLTYNKMKSEYDSLVLKHMNYEDEFFPSLEKKIIVTPAYIYEGNYALNVDVISNWITTTNKSNFNNLKHSFNDFKNSSINTSLKLSSSIKRNIIIEIIIALTEIIAAIFIGRKNSSIN